MAIRLPTFGNCLSVDPLYGNDVGGGIRLGPYKTLAAALAVVQAGEIILLMPGTHTVAAGITVPASVAIEGLSRTASVIELLAAAGDTTLVTMSANSVLRMLSLHLQSTGHHTLKGIVIEDTVSETAQIEDVQLLVDNSTASDAGSSNVYGIHTKGTGAPENHFMGFRRCRISVASAGNGAKRCHLVDGANEARSRNCDYAVHRTGSGAGTYYAAETSHANAVLDIITARLDGDDGSAVGADVSQTSGTLRLTGSILVNNNANGKGLEHGHQVPFWIWGDSAGISSGTKYWRFGDGTAGATEVSIAVTAPCIVHDLTVRAITGPGASRTDTFTVRKNGADTALTTSLFAGATDAQDRAHGVAFAAGDRISLKSVVAASSTLADVVISAEGY